MMNTYFSKKRILITGASSGIGFALCKQLAETDAEIIMVARHLGRLNKAKIHIQEKLGADQRAKLIIHSLDICDERAVAKSMAEICASQPLDILINNAGMASNNHFERLRDSDFLEVITTNFLGQASMCRHVLGGMKTRGQGHIVNVSSLAGVLGIAGYTAYGASKFALVGFTRALRNELAGSNIRTTLILPSDVDTYQLRTEEKTRIPANRAVVSTGGDKISADFAAKRILNAIKKGKKEAVIAPLSAKLIVRICQFFPAATAGVMDTIAAKHNS